MRINSYYGLLFIIVTLLMFYTPILTYIRAHDPDPVQYDEGESHSVEEVEIIIPGNIKSTKDVYISEETNAVADAKRDVRAHVNKTLWFTTGCFFPVIGPAFSQRNIKTVPSARMLGKSPEYVAFYTDFYMIEMKKQRYNWALAGCLLGGITDACLIGILINRYNN